MHSAEFGRRSFRLGRTWPSGLPNAFSFFPFQFGEALVIILQTTDQLNFGGQYTLPLGYAHRRNRVERVESVDALARSCCCGRFWVLWHWYVRAGLFSTYHL